MPRAGKYEYPTRDLDSCVNYLKNAWQITKSTSMTRDGFGDALKISSKSGPFGGLVGSLAQYGLVDTGDGYIRYTELAKAIIKGSPSEINEAKQKAARRVQIFTDIYKHFRDVEVSDDQLKIFLKESASVDVMDAPQQAVEIRKIFKKVAPYIADTNAAENNTVYGGEKKTETLSQQEGRLTDYNEYRLAEGIVIRVPQDLSEEVLQKAWKKSSAAMNIFLDIPKE